ncbi:DNA topoisomerase 2 [Tanacetum coccineum]
MKGGSHVDYIKNLITDYLAEIVNLQPNEIKRYLWVFVNAHIDDPTFDSQTKEKLTTNEGSFRSTCELAPEFLKKIADSLFEDLSKKKSNAGKLNIPKLQDAKLADTPYSQQCTLILTNKDFATDLVMSRLGQDIAKYGVFPLEGNLLNVREASPQELEKNTDIQNIKKILGLQDGKIYENVKELRYGHLMIMVNEDHEGSCIKGLLINFFHYFWPSLLKVKSFMQWFVEPIVKASNKRTNQVFMFYTLSHYQESMKQLENQFNITSYKDFVWDDDKDGDAIELAFSNMKIVERQHWLQAPEDLDLKEKGIPYSDFMNKEFKQYAKADLQRSIPSMVDGLKPHERKILFYALKKPIIQEIEVTQFSIYVLDHSLYHDGEVTLVGTIIGMAQNYVGSNNINLLESNMQLGTRRRGGKDHDHADGTLLSTWLAPITQYLFHKDDELLLDYYKENGQSIEPAWFIPIIPMVLVNGSEARGALSSFIPNYNPRDIIANLKRLLEGKSMLAMLPCYRGFKGEIKNTASNEYTTYGIITKDKDALTITELPVRCWTEDYKEFLEASRCGEDIKDYKACNDDDTSVHFEITMTKDQMNKAEEGGLWNKLKLTTTLSTGNMYVLDAEGKLKKYDTPETLLEDFYGLRLDLYEQRKTSLLHELKIASLQLKSKVREAREEPQKDEDVAVEGYDYLLSLPTESFEPEYIEELEEERKAINKKIEHLTTSTPKSLWLKDLAALDEQLALENYPEAKYTKAEEEEEKRKTSLLHELKIASLQLKNKVSQGKKKPKREDGQQKDTMDMIRAVSTRFNIWFQRYIEEYGGMKGKATDQKIEHLTTSTSHVLYA